MAYKKKEYYFLTANGRREELAQMKTMNLNGMNIVEAVIPKGILSVSCVDNQLTSLTIPEGTKQMIATKNNFKSIRIPKSLVSLSIDKGVKVLNKEDANPELYVNRPTPNDECYKCCPLYWNDTEPRDLNPDTYHPWKAPKLIRKALQNV